MQRYLCQALTLVGCLCWLSAVNANYEFERFSFFSALHVERIVYEEKASLFPVKTKTTVINPTIKNGGMHKLSPRYALLIETVSSLYPVRVQEQWLYNQNKQVFQENSLTYTLSSKRFNLYRRWLQQVHVVAGLEYSLHSFKRFDPQSNLGLLAWDLVESTKAELSLQTGLALQKGSFSSTKWRLSGHGLIGLPIYAIAENTEYTNTRFDQAKGYSLHAQLSLSRAVIKKLHMAVLAEYNYLFRSGQVATFSQPLDAQATLTTKVELPENATSVSRLGISVYWLL